MTGATAAAARRVVSRAVLIKGLAVVAVVAVCCLVGYAFGDLVSPLYHNRNFPWIVARASGIGGFVCLGALCVMGLAFRRPPARRPRVHAESLLRVHVALGPAFVLLLAAHIGSLLADRYSGVNWRSLVVPGAATYRPGAVTYGMFAAEMMVVVFVTATLAGRWGVGRRWALLHKLAYPAFVLTWVHGVLAGSDTSVLRSLYVAEGAVVGVCALIALRREKAWARIRAAG